MFGFVKAIVQHFIEYCQQSKLHGLMFIGANFTSRLEKGVWMVLFILGICYGYMLYTPFLEKWFYTPVYMSIDSSSFDVANIPFPAITICTNNKIVNRQLESVLLTQPWRSLAKKDPEFSTHFQKALTAIVMARENPPMLNSLNKETIFLLNKYHELLTEVLKKVMLTCKDMILECYWFGIKFDDCTELFDVRHTDNGYCCSFNTLPMSEQFINGTELNVGQKNLYEDPCQDWLDLINKKLTSPNYPHEYDPNTICKWELITEKGYYISLDFEMILLEWAYNYGDYLYIYDVKDDGSLMPIANITGVDFGPYSSKIPFIASKWKKKIFSSSSNKMCVVFRTDAHIEETGFSASIYYTPIPSKECQTGLNMTEKNIKSPNYPQLYHNDIKCKWLITVPYGLHITLKFLEIDLEDSKDFLYIYDGGSDDTEIVANLTGTINETMIVAIPRNQMMMVFTTNEEIVGKGFHALIIENDHCQYWLNETAGILTSPDFGINGIGQQTISIANSNCTWILKADEEFYINIEIDFFDVKWGDYLAIYDDQDMLSSPILKWDLYSNERKKTISSSGNQMLVQYVTHGPVAYGFLIKIHHIPVNPSCKNWLDIDNRILKSPQHLSINCSWVITAPRANGISITNVTNANSLKIYNGGSDKDTLISLSTTAENQMFISYTSHGDEIEFIASFTFDDVCENALDLTKRQLIVDKDFPLSTYCQWKISSQNENEYVTLVFHYLKIMSNMNRLLVYDGPNDKSMLIGGLLGTSKHNVVKSISSSGNSMFLTFKKEDPVIHPQFTASINYNKINMNCPCWTDFASSRWIPQINSNIDCSWLITRQFGSYLTLKFRYIEPENGFDYINIYDGGSVHSDLIKSINRVYENIDISIPRNQMFVVYKSISNSTVSKKGFEVSIVENGDSCQYWMDLKKREISSPYYPHNYFSDEDGCDYLITAPKGNIIIVEFVHFNLAEIITHFVSLFDGVCDQTKELATLTGTVSMKDDFKWIFYSSGRYMLVKFLSSDYYGQMSSSGFFAKIHYVDCNIVNQNDIGFGVCFPYGVDDGPCFFDKECKDNLSCGYRNCPSAFNETDNCCTTNELLKSPNYPAPYKPYSKETWQLTASVGSIIMLQFNYFSTHTIHPGNQKNDYLEIYDGLNEQARQISKLNGNLGSFSISSTDNFLFIKFETFYAQFGGFIATINYVKCSIVLNGDELFCNCHTCYENEGDCDYHFHCQDGLVCGNNNCPFVLGFDNEVGCCYQPTIGNEDFCASGIPCGENEGDCDSNSECHSNYFCGSNNCPASLHFDSEIDCCSSTEIMSPNYPNSYPEYAEEIWLITAPTGSTIILQFHSFHVGHNYWDPDSVTIYDGSNEQATQIAKLKGYFESFDHFFYSTKNSLLVKLESDYDYHWNYGGFHATIHYVDCANVSNGELGLCKCESCSENEGDCYSSDECEGDLLCGSNNCLASLGFAPEINCCYQTILKDCTTDNPCDENEGDCDSYDECEGNLLCGSDNCLASLGFDSGVDCCYPCSDTCGVSNWKGDGNCDDENNNCGCEWDGGDCCGGSTYYCDYCECLDPHSDGDDMSTSPPSSSDCEYPYFVGDDSCDDANNNEACEWDGGDCCGSNVNTNYCDDCDCLDPDNGGDSLSINRLDLLLPESCEYSDDIGDDYCDDINNNEACEWDGGDCCGSKVDTDFCLVCECLDPDVLAIPHVPTPAFTTPSDFVARAHPNIDPKMSFHPLAKQASKGTHRIKYEEMFRNRHLFGKYFSGHKRRSQTVKKYSNSILRKSSLKAHEQSGLLHSHIASSKYGLTVILNPNEAEYTDALKNNYVGFKTLVHTPYNFPEVDAVGMAIEKNVKATVGIRGHHAWITEAANSLDLYQKKCLSRSDDVKKYDKVRLEVFANYTRKGCILECHANKFFDKCGCLPYHYPDFSVVWKKSTACNHTALQCMSKLVVYNESCFCPSDCESTQYVFETSTAWRTPRDTSLLIKSYSKKNKLLDNVEKEIVKLDALCISPEEKDIRIQELKQLNKSIAYSSTMIQFFWKQDTLISYVRDQYYTIVDMLANFGGVMGCGIGMSLAATCEIIYWLTLKPIAKWMVSHNINIFGNLKPAYKMLILLIFLSWVAFSAHKFHNVYLTHINRRI